jgi:hypothetical protein
MLILLSHLSHLSRIMPLITQRSRLSLIPPIGSPNTPPPPLLPPT